MKTHRKSALPAFEDFQEKFRQAFGREVSREERRFYRLIGIVLEEDFSDHIGQPPILRLQPGFVHDFNNLLHVLLGHVELLEQAVEKNPKALRHAIQIRETAKDTAALTQQLDACSRKQPRLKPMLVS